jgi:curli biogenesis system outer membrane secretion channel CsgG
MRTRTRTFIAFICLVLLAVVDSASGQEKKRVAVLAFEDGAVRSSSAAALGRNQDVGASLADVLVKELLDGGKYSLIERRAIDQVLKEQNFSNTSRVDAKTAVAIGRVLGVQAIITGSVLQFNVEEKEVSVGSGTLGRVTRGVDRCVGRR